MRLSQRMVVRSVTGRECDALTLLLEELSQVNYSQESIFDDLNRVTAKLPPSLVNDLLDFKFSEKNIVLWLKGVPQGAIRQIPTPSRHGDRRDNLLEDHVLYLAILNVIARSVGFVTQQGGRVVNDIMPIKRRALAQNSSNGSAYRFGFHTEDSFLRRQPDFFSLYCVRNPAGPGITLAAVDKERLPVEIVSQLSGSQYRILPNPSQAGWRHVSGEPTSILFGSKENNPRFRLNSEDMAPVDSNDSISQAALDYLCQHLERNSMTLDVGAGDLVIVDNHRVAHARDAYTPRYDGFDRWLLRLVSYESLEELNTEHQSLTGRLLAPASAESGRLMAKSGNTSCDV